MASTTSHEPIPDLWPEDLEGPATITPEAILRRQAEALGSRTHNFVSASVESRSTSNGKSFEHNLIPEAPFLRFRFPLVRITHGPALFPVQIAETDLTKGPNPDSSYWNLKAEDEQQLLEAIKSFFNLDRVKALIRSLISQSNETEVETNGA